LNLQEGDNLVSNPLDSGNNVVGNLFPNVDDGTTLYKWDDTSQTYIVNTFAFGQWLNPNMIFAPGEGAFLNVPQAITIALTGTAMEGRLMNFLPANAGNMPWAIRSSMVPQTGLLQSKLLFPPQNGYNVYLFNEYQQAYESYSYIFGAWHPSEPVLSIGKSFWLERPVDNRRFWIREFWVPREP
jgi:hypothetical protein